MVQALQVKDAVQAVVWDEGKAKAEAEWVDRTPQDRVVVVYVRNARQYYLMPLANLAMHEVVQDVVRK